MVNWPRIENDKHFFALVMEVSADAAFRLEDPPVQEEEISIQIVLIEKLHNVQQAGSSMGRPGWCVLRRISVGDALGQGLARREWNNQNNREEKRRRARCEAQILPNTRMLIDSFTLIAYYPIERLLCC
jgi:hypothetical protein